MVKSFRYVSDVLVPCSRVLGFVRHVGVVWVGQECRCSLCAANSQLFQIPVPIIVYCPNESSTEYGMQLIEKKTGSGWRGPPGNAGWLGRGLQERKGNEGAGNCRIMRLIKNKNKEKKRMKKMRMSL